MSIQWALVFFTLFVGLGVGTIVTIAITEWWGKASSARMPGAIVSLVALAVGGFCSILHLGHPERIFGALGHPTSGIFLEMLLIGLTGIGIIIYMVMLSRKSADSSRRIEVTITAIPAVILAFAVGASYVMPSRPAWNTIVLPLLYAASAAVMGCFTTSFLAARKEEDAAVVKSLGFATLIALAVQALLVIVYLIYLGGAQYADATASASRLVSGDLAALFWVGLVIIGIVGPAVLAWMQRTKKEGGMSAASMSALGLVCVLVGGVVFRALMYSLGSGIAEFFGPM